MSMTYDRYGYDCIRDDVIESLNLYVTNHIEPGGFLRAVLENNLTAAVGAADDWNIQTLPNIVIYVYNNLPAICCGNPAAVSQWLGAK